MRKLIAGNWKMHGSQEWLDKVKSFEKLLPSRKRSHIEILICPPFPYISGLAENAKGTEIAIGGQNCHANATGAHTGEVSAEMLVDCGAQYVIVGHSERRAGGESDADVKAKAAAAARGGLVPIICVGETLSQREAGDAQSVVSSQIAGSVPSDVDKYVVAYEPVWAIGTGKVAEISDIEDMHNHIRKAVGKSVRILYGGSVKPGNAKDILKTENVDGALIGGASLNMEDFSEIAKSA